jgi:hypothetical protein
MASSLFVKRLLNFPFSARQCSERSNTCVLAELLTPAFAAAAAFP